MVPRMSHTIHVQFSILSAQLLISVICFSGRICLNIDFKSIVDDKRVKVQLLYFNSFCIHITHAYRNTEARADARTHTHTVKHQVHIDIYVFRTFFSSYPSVKEREIFHWRY